MKIKISNYIAKRLVQAGISHVFTVTGGGAMHLNDGLGHEPGLTCIYNHHEQACAIAAESYARIHNTIAAVCVTTGPGGTNAITGVLGGYLDSIPMLVLSGQVRYDTTARSTGLKLRAMGDQEFDITKAIDCMTKYSEMVTDPMRIRYALEKALYLAQTGRPGPCWLDIPLNVQGAYVEEDELVGFEPSELAPEVPETSETELGQVLSMLKEAKRPVFYAGNGIRIAGAHDVFMRVIEKLNIPVVTGWDSIDAIYDEHPLYVGRGGIMGDRPGNFAVQNSDLVFAVGNRLSIRQVGYNYATWARAAKVIMVDADAEEMKKPTLHVDLPVHADAKEFLEKLEAKLSEDNRFTGDAWLAACGNWKKKYPVVQPKHYEPAEQTNVYAFIRELSSRLQENQVTVVGNGSACVVGSHGYVIKKGQRFIINSAVASMGYDLPAAIGACIGEYGNRALRARRCLADVENSYVANGMGNITAENGVTDELQDIILVTGDGSIQMNLQELQTIIHHKLPIKIFIINNRGYHSIRQTQKNFFGEPLVGIGYDSGDLSFPDMEKLAAAYGYSYERIEKNEELADKLDRVLAVKEPVICEIMVSTTQNFEPKSATKRLPDGTLVSAPLEDLAPFLPEDELAENMFIPVIGH
ncbi:MAG: thiamine pyrophosphate-binding protein [Lachnospiraceae bacterium]|nr:thiamine pyrophosphate-binding protein [Lachnospiraceae bacterium]